MQSDAWLNYVVAPFRSEFGSSFARSEQPRWLHDGPGDSFCNCDPPALVGVSRVGLVRDRNRFYRSCFSCGLAIP